MTGAYAIAVGVVVAATAVGLGARELAGGRASRGLAPVTGLAVLLVVARIAVELPGRAGTSLAAMSAVLLGSLALLARARRPAPGVALVAAVTAGLVLAAVSLPFLANGRFGPLGVSVNNDPALHVAWVGELRDGVTPVPERPRGYPIGPHAVMAAAAEVTGDGETAFVGLLMAVPVLTALTALGLLGSLSPPRRVLGALLGGLPYLAASYYAQASYKEPIVALMLVGVALVLHERSRGRLTTGATLALLGLLSAAVVTTFSWIGLAWPAAAVAAWWAGQAAVRHRLPAMPDRRAAVAAAAAALGVVVLVVLDRAGSNIVDLGSPGSPGGNLVARLSPFEGLGVWFQPDFRYAPGSLAGRRALELLALAALAFAAVWWARRRQTALPATVAGAAAIYVVAAAVASPYVSAKALAILAPVTMLALVRPLVEPRRAAGALLAVAFLGAAAWSSTLALRGAMVGDRAHARSLDRLRPWVREHPTLFAGKDDYAVQHLRGARLSTSVSSGVLSAPVVATRPEKPDQVGAPVDFDSPPPADLDRFRYAITTTTRYASLPPPNWRRVTADRFYTLWERRGPTPRARVLDEGVAPGAVLRCPGALRGTRGRALVRAAPRLADPGGWIRPSGRPAPAHAPDTLEPGQTVTTRMRLPPGRWELSLQYLGPTSLRVRAPGLRRTLSASLERPGPWWSIGELRSRGGPVTVSVAAEALPWLSVRRTVALGALAATRVDAPARSVPLASACGAYVDRYTTAP
ncbi:MAG TPA: hypothetical protein VNB64_05405 [Solirubrobacteraceae bacterium]|nr:hypothetical protein [Solirubrobacteraceae bacterium]